MIELVQHAFGDKELPLGSPQGVAPNQVDSTGIAGSYMTLGFVGLLAIGIVAAMLAPEEHKFAQDVVIKPGIAVKFEASTTLAPEWRLAEWACTLWIRLPSITMSTSARAV